MKKAKILSAAFVAAAAFGAVSCSNDAQDVNVVTDETSHDYNYFTKVTGTYKPAGATTAFTVDPVSTRVSWSTSKKFTSNAQSYSLGGAYLRYKDADNNTQTVPFSVPYSVYERDGKYYKDDGTEITSLFTGKVTDAEFTYKIEDATNGTLTLKFTRL